MSNAINRTTRQLRRSIHTPDYSVVDWIINPNLSLLDGIVPQKYWKIVGNTVVEMSQSEKDVVDASETSILNIPIVGTQMVIFTDSRVGSNQYINIGSLSSGMIGLLLPTRGIVRHISTQWSSGSDNFNINLRKNGVATNLYTINAIGNSKQAVASNINISLSAGDSIQIYTSDIDSSISNLVVVVWFELLGN